MKNLIHLLQINLQLYDYKFSLLCFVTAFIVTLIAIPPIIYFSRRYKLYDMPNARKEHSNPVPTMGGIAIFSGLMIALLLWFPFRNEVWQVSFFIAIMLLFMLGIMDDMKELSARYKFVIQIAIAFLVALSGIRITSFEGLFGINELPVYSQYTFTILAIVGITNAFNLVDGIDGLAGGLGFMSLVTLGVFLTISGDVNGALIAFALAGGLLAFLHYNFSPAKIFMGDTGSLILGFTISVLCIRMLNVNSVSTSPILNHIPVFILGIVLIPVFDALRVFAIRIWKGKSPFEADKTHIHHLLTNNGFSHSFSVRVIYFLHALILIEAYLLKELRSEYILLLMIAFMITATFILKRSKLFLGKLAKLDASYNEPSR